MEYSYWNSTVGKQILVDLDSKRVVLTRADIANIPSQDRYMDIYLFLIKHGYAEPTDNCQLMARCYWYYVDKSSYAPAQWADFPLRKELRDTLILHSGKAFFKFLKSLAKLCKGRQRFVDFAIREIPTLLDTAAAKELSWWSHSSLDELRIHYEKELGAEHSMTRCLVQRWLLDLKELYQTEKQIQKWKMDHCKEQIMMNRWHPDRVEKLLRLGYEVEDM